MDKNEYYGGTEAALSLQEIEAWVEKVNDGRPAKERSLSAVNLMTPSNETITLQKCYSPESGARFESCV